VPLNAPPGWPSRPALAALLLALAGPPTALAGPTTTTASVLSIGDGDTLRLRTAAGPITVRLACIDAPESDQVPHGPAARRDLQELLPPGTTVWIRRQSVDRYGRSVAELIRDGRIVNQLLVASGSAFVYRSYSAACDRNTYARLELEARQRRRGVWANGDGITRPWDHRAGRRTPRRAGPAEAGGAPLSRRWRCSEIGSFARAQQLLRDGHGYLDGDGDGIACERLRG
jgi:endonuclease YncB( thermonuclease family)